MKIIIFIFIFMSLIKANNIENRKINLNYIDKLIQVSKEVNSDIFKERQYLLSKLKNNDFTNDKVMSKYGFNKIKLTEKEIYKRVEPVPLEIMLVQAYVESANGTSRFAKLGNNYFGIWTYKEEVEGFIPKERSEGEIYKVQKFKTLKEAVHRYYEILNSSLFYSDFRNNRYKKASIKEMLLSLKKYAEEEKYTEILISTLPKIKNKI